MKLNKTFKYQLSGYIFETNVFLPELIASDGEATCSIFVKKTISPGIPVEALGMESYYNPSLQLRCIKNKQLGFVAIRNNKDIELVPDNEFDEATLRMLMLGSVSMILASVLGYVSLHAACVVINEKAVLFCAKSGSGKSSLAAYFYDEGYTVLSDDVTNIKISEAGEIYAYPSVPRAKLSESSLHKMGKSMEGLDVIPVKIKKYSLPFTQALQVSYPVALIVFPEFEEVENNIEYIKGKNKLTELLKHLYRKKTTRLLGTLENRNKMLFTMAMQLDMCFYKRSEKTENMQGSLAFIKKELLHNIR